MTVVYEDKRRCMPSEWKVKKYDERLSKTCWRTSGFTFARSLPEDCNGSIKVFLMKSAIENEDVYVFSDDWLKKMHIDVLDDDEWPEFVELDMLRPMQTTC